MTCTARLLPIVINVFLEPVFPPFLSRRFRSLNYWNIGRYMLLRKRVRSNDPSNLVQIAGARAWAGNVSGNLSPVAFGVRRDGAHDLQWRGSHTEIR
jgi:N-acyl-L-homoserine lactone synthetase